MQLYHLVLGCVICMFIFIFINRSELVWSGEKRSRTVLQFLRCSGVSAYNF